MARLSPVFNLSTSVHQLWRRIEPGSFSRMGEGWMRRMRQVGKSPPPSFRHRLASNRKYDRLRHPPIFHVRTFFTPKLPARAGTFLDVAQKLPHLAGLSVTAIQLLPDAPRGGSLEVDRGRMAQVAPLDGSGPVTALGRTLLKVMSYGRAAEPIVPAAPGRDRCGPDVPAGSPSPTRAAGPEPARCSRRRRCR